MKRHRRFFLQPVMRKICIVLDDHLNGSVRKTFLLGAVSFDQRCLAACFDDDDKMRKGTLAVIATDIDLERLFNAGLLWNTDHFNIGKGEIQCSKSVSLEVEPPDKLHQFLVRCGREIGDGLSDPPIFIRYW